MIRPRWSKVLRDLWGNRARTVLVVLSIAVGVFTIGAISGSRVVLERDMNASYMSVNPSSAILFTEPFDNDFVETIKGIKGVKTAEGRRQIRVRLNVGPETWRDLTLVVVPDYSDIKIDKIRPVEGAWPPPEHELLIERASLGLVKAGAGDSILIKAPDNKQRQMRIAGVVHDLNEQPALFTGVGYGYITLDTLEWLGETRDLNELHIIADNALDKEYIQNLSNKIRDRVEKSGYEVYYTYIPDPGKHPADSTIQAILMVLGILGVLALLLSGFLVINTLSALLTQQVRQIGIMKAIGGRASQIMGMYFTMVAMYGLLSLTVAVPLGAIGAQAFSSYMAGLVNFDLKEYAIPPQVFGLQAAVGLIVPLLAALYPVIVGTRITVREALSDYGISHINIRAGLFDKLLGRFPGLLSLLSRPVLIAIRNTFSRKGRLALTLVTLTMGGAIFIGVLSVNASLKLTLEDAMKYWLYDIEVTFSESHPLHRIEYEMLKIPGVTKAESWGFVNARRLRVDGNESNNIIFIAPPVGTELLKPEVLQGRWLLPEDENAVVFNTELLKDEPDIKVGDSVTFKINDRKTSWRVVGIVKGVLTGPIAYTNYPYFSAVVHNVGTANSAYVVTAQHDPAFHAKMARDLEEHCRNTGLRIQSVSTTSDIRSRVQMQFNILVALMAIMAVLLAVTGGLGLMGTMSINVLERMREIGVMRAIGASDWAVMRIFLVEGIFIGFLSWVLSTLISLPLSKFLSNAIGIAFMKAPLSYCFSPGGALLWLVIVVILATLASLLPARHAAGLSVREVLAYQ